MNEASENKLNDNNICLKCTARGLCCYPSVVVNDIQIALLDEPCEFQDPETKLCTIYEHRHDREKLTGNTCLTIDEMLEQATVPVSCLYVKNKAKYRKRKDRRHYSYDIKVKD